LCSLIQELINFSKNVARLNIARGLTRTDLIHTARPSLLVDLRLLTLDFSFRAFRPLSARVRIFCSWFSRLARRPRGCVCLLLQDLLQSCSRGGEEESGRHVL
jgi:hypothetical protein